MLGTVTGAQLVCPLGYDRRNACAASRAGLSRISGHPSYLVETDDGAPNGAPLDVHAAELETSGFESFGTLVRLTNAVLDVSVRDGLFDAVDESAARIYFALSPDVAADKPELVARQLLSEAFHANVLPIQLALGGAFALGATSFAACLAAAATDFATAGILTAYVISVDSLLDESVLSTLETSGRLKTPTQPTGLQPSEAAVLIRIDSEWAPSGSDRRVIRLSSPILRDAAENDRESIVANAKILSELVLAGRENVSRDLHWIISDQNGELWRGNQWGTTEVFLRSTLEEDLANELWVPALNFGDVRSSSCGIGLCMAQHAVERGRAPSDFGMVVSSEVGGRHSAVAFCVS